MEKFKKISDVCKELKISRQTINNWRKKGLINIIKSESGSVFVEVSSYQKYKKFIEDYGE